jgi:hypothetical protein
LWDSIHPYSLQGALKSFVICGSCLVNSLLLSKMGRKQNINKKNTLTDGGTFLLYQLEIIEEPQSNFKKITQ